MIIKELDIGSQYQRDTWNKRLKQGKIKATFSDENAANQYVNWLKSKNIDAEIHPYSLGSSVSYIVNAVNRQYNENWIDDEDDLDSGDIVYEGRAYYNRRYSGLAHSEQFSNASDMHDWVWVMCQDGYYVTVYDYEDGEYSYYKWPDNAEYMDLSSVEELETDERGNFLYIDDIGLK